MVTDANGLKADLGEVALSVPAQGPQLAQYQGALTQIAMGAGDAAAGDYLAADQVLPGVAAELGQIPSVLGTVCKTG